MTRVQVIGLPGSGKSYGINLWKKAHPEYRGDMLDIVDFVGPNKEKRFLTAAKQSSSYLIAESACGIYLPQSIIIKLEPTIGTVYRQLKARGEEPDADYLSILSTIMLPAHHILKSSEELPEMLSRFMLK